MKHHIAILILTMGILVKGASDSRVKRQSNSSDYQENKKKLNPEESKITLTPSESSHRDSHPDSRESLDSDYKSSDGQSSPYHGKSKEHSRSNDYDDDDDDDYRDADETHDYNSGPTSSTRPKDLGNSGERYEDSYHDSKDLKKAHPIKGSYSEPLDGSHHDSTSNNRKPRIQSSYPEEDTHSDNSDESTNSYYPATSERKGSSHYPHDPTESSSSYGSADKRAPVPSHHAKSYYPSNSKKMEDMHRSTETEEPSSHYYANNKSSHPESSYSSPQSNNSGRSGDSYNPSDYRNSHKSESGGSDSSYHPNYPDKSSNPHHLKTSANSYQPKNYGKLNSGFDDSDEDHNEKSDHHSPSSVESTKSHDNSDIPFGKNDHSKYSHENGVYQYYNKPNSEEYGKASSYHTSKHGPMSSEDGDQVNPPTKSLHEAVTAASVKIDAETISYTREQSEDKAHKGEGSMKLESKAKRHYNNYYHPYKTTPPPAIPGVAGVDYPILAAPPATGFNCSRHRLAGYYADPAAQCQVFYICQADGRQDAFLCPNGTIFNQQYLVCDWWYNVNCAKSASYYKVNSKLYVAAASKTVKSADTKKNYKSNSDEKDKASSGAITRIQAVGYGKNDKSVNSYAYQEVTEGAGSDNSYVYDY